MILQTLQFDQFSVQKMILYEIVVQISKRRFFYDIVHFIDKDDIVTYVEFDCGITFFPENPTKISEIERRTELNLQILWKKPVHSQQRSIYLFCWWAA